MHSTDRFGWILNNGIHKIQVGKFYRESDRNSYVSALNEVFPETKHKAVPALLILVNDGWLNSVQHVFGILYLEKYLDEQETMDVHRSLLIHDFVKTLINGSENVGYIFEERLIAAKACLDANKPRSVD